MRWNCCEMDSRSLYVFRQHDLDTPACAVAWKAYPPHPVARDWVSIHHISVPLNRCPACLHTHTQWHTCTYTYGLLSCGAVLRKHPGWGQKPWKTMNDHESAWEQKNRDKNDKETVLFPLTFNCNPGIQTIDLVLLINPVRFFKLLAGALNKPDLIGCYILLSSFCWLCTKERKSEHSSTVLSGNFFHWLQFSLSLQFPWVLDLHPPLACMDFLHSHWLKATSREHKQMWTDSAS